MLIRQRRLYLWIQLTAACAALSFGGCTKNRSGPATNSTAAQTEATTAVTPVKLLESAVQILQAPKRGQSAPAAYRKAAELLNQYLQLAGAAGQQLVEPLSLDLKRTLAARLSARQLQHIENGLFDQADSLHLERCFELRDIVAHVTADQRDDRAKAESLFDWVIRNVQVVPSDQAPPFAVAPNVSLLLGRSTDMERAWLFMELLRQCGIDSVLLGYLEAAPAQTEPRYVVWLPAVLLDDSLCLFDTTIGLPVPGPDGKGVATLRQVLEQPALLAALDLDAEHPYRVHTENLKQFVVLYESSPLFWAPRMAFLQERLTGKSRAVLAYPLEPLAKRARVAADREVVEDLWELPLAVDENSRGNPDYMKQITRSMGPYLFIDEVLQARLDHLRGKYPDAMRAFMDHRTSQPILENAGAEAKEIYNWVREDSTYFLGLVKFEQHEYAVASNWFGKSYLERYPTGRWASAARYNLGRCAEAQQDIDHAILNYTADDLSPQAPGNRLRARRLGWTPKAAAATTPEPAP